MDLVRALPNPAALWHRLTQRSNSNFKFAFLFLGPEQRDGLQQVYEFCRVVDDIVDERAPGPEGEASGRCNDCLGLHRSLSFARYLPRGIDRGDTRLIPIATPTNTPIAPVAAA